MSTTSPSIHTVPGIARLPSQSPKNKIRYSDITSRIDGLDLGGLLKLWKDCAASESRIELIAELKNKNIGFNEIEQFGLGLKYSLKSKQLVDKNEKQIEKVIQAAMRLKLKDEIQHNKEMKKEKNKERNRMARRYHQQTETYKKTMRYLRQEAEKTRRMSPAKYKRKIQHLETRYKERGIETEDGETALSPGMEELANLRVSVLRDTTR